MPFNPLCGLKFFRPTADTPKGVANRQRSGLFKQSKRRGRILFLIEHKSHDDPDLMKQFLSYQNGIYQQTQDPVIPVFVNQSPNKTWKGPKDFHGYLNNFDGELRECFKDNVLNFRPRVLNIQSLDVKKEAGSLTVRSILYIILVLFEISCFTSTLYEGKPAKVAPFSKPVWFMRHIWDLDESKVRELFTISEGLSAEDRKFLVDRAVDYIRRFDPHFSWEIVKEVDQTIKEKEGRVMPPLQISLDEAQEKGWKLGQVDGRKKGRQEGLQEGMQQGMQQGRQEGMQQGMQQGRQEVALNFLSAGLDLETVSKCTGLSEEEIKKLKNDS